MKEDRFDSQPRHHNPVIGLSTDEARAGRTPHVVRYVLAISLALIIIGFAAVYAFGWSNWSGRTEEIRASNARP